MSEAKSNSEIIAGLAEEFVERYRRGERPPVSEYMAQHPELAEEIREFFAAVAMVENLAPAASDSFGDPDSQSPSESLPALKQLGDFRIVREIGRGGMGVVFEAEQVSLGRHVALKVLPASALPDSNHVRRFEREAKSAAKLHHTNIVPVFGVGEQESLHYYVMQFIQGLPLDEVIAELKKIQAQPTGTIASATPVPKTGPHHRQQSVADVAQSLMTGQFAETFIGDSDSDRESSHTRLTESLAGSQDNDSSASRVSETLNLSGSLSGSTVSAGKSGIQSASHKQLTYWQRVANIGLQVADAMQHAHDHGILHRDIKPSNLLLDMRGTAWVTDFGLAKATDQQDITHTGDIMGTLRYMPPEAFEGIADARSDVYSLGLTLYELLCFQPAFGMKDRNRLIKQVTTEAAPRLEKLNPEIPRDLVTIVHKAIDRDATHRYQTAQELQGDLQRFVNDEPIQARRISTAERFARWSRRNKGLAASLAAVGLLLLVINIAGPVITWRMSVLNDSLEGKQVELNDTIDQLEDERNLAKRQASEMSDLAAAKDAETLVANASRKDARQKQLEADRQRSLARRALYSSTLFAAQHGISTPDGYARAQDLLDEVRPQAGETEDLRGWEWYYLNSQPPPGPLVLSEFTNWVIAVCVSPDGNQFATADGNGTVKIFATESGRLLQRLRGHGSAAWTVAWSPDGTRVASGSSDKTARIWNVNTGREELRLIGHTDRVRDVAWSPDGSRLATVSLDKTLRTWDTSTGEHLLIFKGHTAKVRTVNWNSDGTRLVSGAGDATVRIWDSRSGETIRVLTGHSGAIGGVQFSPDDRRIASTANNDAAKPAIVWDAERGEELFALTGYNSGGAQWVRWSPDGRQLATAGERDRILRVWDSVSGNLVREFSGHEDRHLFQCSWTPDARKIVTAGSDQTVRIWNVVEEHSQPDFSGHTNPIRRLAWSPDGSRIASASMDATVRIWDVRTKRESLAFRGHRQSVLHVDWSPDGTQLASCGLETSFQIWNSETGEVLRTVTASDGGQINAVVWSPDGTQIATGSNDTTVRVFDVETGNEVQRFRTNERVLYVCWHPDGKQIAACIYYPGVVKVWDVESGDEAASIRCPSDTLFRVSISPDGKRIAAGGFVTPRENPFEETVGSRTGVLKLWDMSTGRELFALRGHSNYVWSICWSRDGTRLLSTDWDGRLILWDTATGRQLLVLNSTAPPAGMIQYCPARFSPDELQIASTSEATGIRLWDATPSYAAELSDRLLPTLQARIASNPTFNDLKLKGEILARQGEWDEAAESFEQAALAANQTIINADRWFTSPWWVAGPYPEPLDAVQPPEKNLDPFSPIPSVSDNVPNVSTWEATVLGADQGLNLGRFFHRAEHISGYAQLRIYSPAEQRVGVLFGADDAVRLWFNGELIHHRSGLRPAVRDDEAADVTLQPGWNTLLAKVSNHTVDHGLFLRLSDDPVAVASVFARNEKWTQALAWWERAYAARPEDREVLLGRGRAELAVGRTDVATEFFDALLADNEPSAVRGVAFAYADHAQSLIAGGRASEAANSLARARTLYEALLSDDRATEQDATGLAAVVLADIQPKWTVLRPDELNSKGGATLTTLEDGSVLASGEHVSGDTYTITTESALTEIRAVRLEAIPDDSLPNRGPGRHTSGNFQLRGFQLLATSNGNDGQLVTVPIVDAWASYSYARSDIRQTIDNTSESVPAAATWHVFDRPGERHFAVYVLEQPLRLHQGDKLAVVLKHRVGLTILGRFRLSVSDTSEVFDTHRERYAFSRLTDPWAQLGAAYAVAGDSTQAAEWFAKALQKVPGFAARRQLVEQIDQLQTDLSDLLALRPDDPLLLHALAKRQAEVGRQEAAAESLAAARSLTEALLKESPNDESLAGFLADLLLAADTTEWTVLEPVEMSSAGGATLTRKPDGSILASGVNPDSDSYELVMETELKTVTAMRLEALTDDSLPNRGPGRGRLGNFAMNWTPAFEDSELSRVALDAVQADYSNPKYPINIRRWNVGGGEGRPHEAVYRMATPIQSDSGFRFRIDMQFQRNPDFADENLGRFRVSATDDPVAFEANARRLTASRLSDPWARLGVAYAAAGDSTQAAEWFAKALQEVPGFAARRQLVEQIDQLQTDLSDLLALRPGDPLLLHALAKRQAAAGQMEAAAESLATARRLAEGLVDDAGNWTVLEPIEANGEAGETLSVESDGSIFVSGPNPKRAIYTLVLPLNGRPVSAIRLETLPDARLPHGGSGRYPENGNFHLSIFTAELVTGDDGESKPIPIVSASDDYHFGPGFSANVAIDGSPNTHWDIHPYIQKPHSAVFTLRSPVESTDGHLMITLDSGITSWGHHGLGRFRLSVTESPHAVESPDYDALAGFLTDLLLADTTEWTVLEPIEMTSAGGATLTKLDDNSVLAGGKNPDHDLYTVTTETDLQKITAIRLEALTDDSLPSGGPGRLERGRFNMTRIRVAAVSPENPEAPVGLKLDAATADYFHQGFFTPNGRWLVAVGSGAGGPCTAIYRVSGEQIESLEGSRLRFDMEFSPGADYPGRNLGRFRISATDDPAAFEMNDRRFTIPRIEDPFTRLGALYAAVGDSTQAMRWFSRSLDRTLGFAARRELIERIDQLQTDLSDLVVLHPGDPLLLSVLAKRQAEAGQTEAAAESLAAARSLTKELLTKSPADETLAGLLADLMLADTTVWTVLKPIEMTSEGGATLTLQADASILASGENRTGDVYTIRAAAGIPEIRAIRLEALPDPSLPNHGPGRHPSGNFQLKAFRVLAAATNDAASGERLPIADARASYAYDSTDVDIRGIVGEDDSRIWHVFGRSGERHVAVFRLLTPCRIEPGQALIVQCAHTDREAGINLGRFRLCVTDDPAAFDIYNRRFTAGRIEDPWERLAATYHLTGDKPALDDLLDRRPHAAMGIASAADPSQSIAWLNRAMNVVAGNAAERARILRLRGALYVRSGQWERAAADYAESVEMDPAAGSIAWMLPAALWAYADEAEPHREWTRKMAERFRTSAEAADAERTVKVMLLMENGLDPEHAPVEPFLAALAGDALTPQNRIWFLSARALLACRSGEFDDAQDDVDQSLQLSEAYGEGSASRLLALAVQAVIHAKRGNVTAAQATVDELKTLLADKRGLEWQDDGSLEGSTILDGVRVDHDLLIPEILRRESQQIIQAGVAR